MLTSVANFVRDLGPYLIVTHLISVIAACIGIFSMQLRTQKGIAVMQTFSCLLWSLHMFMLGAVAGGCTNLVSSVRSVIFSYRSEHEWARKPIWYAVFMAGNIVSFVIALTNGDGLWAILPLIGGAGNMLALAMKDAFRVRCVTFFASPCWLVYNIWGGSIVGILNEIFTLVSIIVGVIRIDIPAIRKSKKEKEISV